MRTRLREFAAWVRRHPFRAMSLVGLLGFVTLNVVAYRHARAMLWFTRGGVRTVRPERLTTVGKVGVLLSGVRVPRPENDRTPADIALHYGIATIPVDERVTLQAWTVPVKEAQGTAILFHGYASSKSELLPEAAALHDMQQEVWLIDFRGSGGSSESYTTIGFHEAEDVAAAVRFVRAKPSVQPILLYGRSMGAAAVLRAVDYGDVKADAIVLESVFDRLSTTCDNRFRLMGLPPFPASNLLIAWGGVCGGFAAGEHNPVDYARRCTCPTVMLHGELDLNARIAEAQAVHHALGDPLAEFVVFPETGHSPTLAADPPRWRDAVQRLIARARAQFQ